MSAIGQAQAEATKHAQQAGSKVEPDKQKITVPASGG